jgi:glycosyltransferase involved in cell wall biosynthesis
MTVYNDLRFLDEAVDSILHQEFRDLELIIVDDGTGQDALFRALEHRDPRVRLVVNPTNIGTAAAANRGIETARGDIIVRLDADDVAEPARIGSLVTALSEDPELGLVGSWCTLIEESGRSKGVQPMPESDLEIRWTILFHNPFYHSTVAFRRALFERAGRYRVEELVSQDHYLWFDLLPLCRARNIPEPLVRYRMNPRGLTAINAKNARNRTHPIREALWAQLGLTYDLYDDSFALEITQFMRGYEIVPPERRLPAYRVILTVLRAFLAARQQFPRTQDREAARQLRRTTVGRMMASSPADLRETLTLCGLCWRIDPQRTLTAVAARLVREFRVGWQAAKNRVVRPGTR